MDKLQILFPEPQLRRLRILSRREDRPVSELVRRAVDLWLDRHETSDDSVREEPPRFHCGEILAASEDMRKIAFADRS